MAGTHSASSGEPGLACGRQCVCTIWLQIHTFCGWWGLEHCLSRLFAALFVWCQLPH